MAEAKRLSQDSGAYLVIEGMDGTGKSSQANMLLEYLTDAGADARLINEPGGTGFGNALREVLKDGSLQRSPESNLDIFMVARRELRDQVIIPANEAGTIVISDRNWFSSYAYQGFGEGLDLDYIRRRAEECLFYDKYMKPAAVILDMSVKAAFKRIKGRGGGGTDYFDGKGQDYFDRVSRGYRYISKVYEAPLIDADRPMEEVHDDIVNYLGAIALKL